MKPIGTIIANIITFALLILVAVFFVTVCYNIRQKMLSWGWQLEPSLLDYIK